jgi:hypothetical protein
LPLYPMPEPRISAERQKVWITTKCSAAWATRKEIQETSSRNEVQASLEIFSTG